MGNNPASRPTLAAPAGMMAERIDVGPIISQQSITAYSHLQRHILPRPLAHDYALPAGQIAGQLCEGAHQPHHGLIMFQRLGARKARSWHRGSMPIYICAYIHRYMASKTISIRDDVYDLLKGAKREDESFSDAIERLVRKDRTDLSEYFGALKDSPLLDSIEADSKMVRDMARSRI